jgi:hypothetical protein
MVMPHSSGIIQSCHYSWSDLPEAKLSLTAVAKLQSRTHRSCRRPYQGSVQNNMCACVCSLGHVGNGTILITTSFASLIIWQRWPERQARQMERFVMNWAGTELECSPFSKSGKPSLLSTPTLCTFFAQPVWRNKLVAFIGARSADESNCVKAHHNWTQRTFITEFSHIH